jgi:hypothetical protein
LHSNRYQQHEYAGKRKRNAYRVNCGEKIIAEQEGAQVEYVDRERTETILARTSPTVSSAYIAISPRRFCSSFD